MTYWRVVGHAAVHQHVVADLDGREEARYGGARHESIGKAPAREPHLVARVHVGRDHVKRDGQVLQPPVHHVL